MFFLNGVPTLWFLSGGGVGSAVTSAQVCVSIAYNLSASITPFDRDIELSAFAFNLSANLGAEGLEDQHYDVEAGIDAVTDISVSPIYLLDQTGSQANNVNAAYNVTASITATISPDVTPILVYNVSASLSVEVQSAVITDVALTYNISVSVNQQLQIQPGDVEIIANLGLGMSCVITTMLLIRQPGGLVYSRKKGYRIPVLVGFPES